MGLRKLFGADDGDDRGPRIDTVLATVLPQPGQRVDGEVLFRAGWRKLRIHDLNLDVVSRAREWDGSTVDCQEAALRPELVWFDVERRTDRRVGFRGRLPWGCPVTELTGRSTGVDLALVTTLGYGSDDVRDLDFLHVAALPLHEAVMDALLAEGYRFTGSELLNTPVPGIEHRDPQTQVFHLEDPAGDPAGFPALEVVFVTNAVGATVFVRRAARHLYWWKDRPPAVSFPVAHHEAGPVDLGPRLRDALGALAVLDRSPR
ncbi:sporulation protein [Kitasatospora phosalacinea]|uniref:sporulation protein n=1 Tax=Kitasatospora phosalacinea TaxID=2065 RepID=UPI0005260A3F|nr:sporulation protein [Kitasatospora phosalacinea]